MDALVLDRRAGRPETLIHLHVGKAGAHVRGGRLGYPAALAAVGASRRLKGHW